jgi:AraC-like DNA-binding protein
MTNSSPGNGAAGGDSRMFFGAFSTGAFRKGEELEAWMHLAALGSYHVRADVPKGERLRAHGVVRVLPGLAMYSGIHTAFEVTWDQRRGTEDIFLCFNHGARIVSKRPGREATVAQRADVILLRGDVDIDTLLFDGLGGGVTLLRAPREFVRVSEDARQSNQKLQAGRALALLQTYLGVMKEPEAMATARQQEMAVSHVHDLIALAIGATGEEKEAAILRGGAAARLYALKKDVERFLFHHDLCAEFLALRNAVTPRHVHRLFEAEGASLSQYVLERRLLEGYRLLAQREARGRTVTEIAFSLGFNDLSYFNRTFARRFNAQPREVRRLFHII